MYIRFTKMHGLGNDFVVIDAVTQTVAMTAKLARRLANRNTGIGCDQLLLIEPPSLPDTDFKYRIFNADGSEVVTISRVIRLHRAFPILNPHKYL